MAAPTSVLAAATARPLSHSCPQACSQQSPLSHSRTMCAVNTRDTPGALSSGEGVGGERTSGPSGDDFSTRPLLSRSGDNVSDQPNT